MSEQQATEPRLASVALQGHEGAASLFRTALASGRLPHAWLITRPAAVPYTPLTLPTSYPF